MKNLRKIFAGLLIVVTGLASFAEDKPLNEQLEDMPPLSEEQITDVVKLLRFVRTAEPQTFVNMTGPFEAVDDACSEQKFDPILESNFGKTVKTIREKLPKSNRSLMAQIRVGVWMGKGAVYDPAFKDKDNVLLHTHKLLEEIKGSYSKQQFEECTYLIARVAESRDNDRQQPQARVASLRR